MEKTISNSKTLSSRLAFTMAEILISLTIIGVIAAITLPALRANINENTLNTKRKALYTRMSQAIGMMGTVGGYGVLYVAVPTGRYGQPPLPTASDSGDWQGFPRRLA